MAGETSMQVVDFKRALDLVMQHARGRRKNRVGLATEIVPLLETAGRVLAEPVLADRDQPPFNRSTRDGFALRAAEFSAAVPLKIIGQLRAGESWQAAPLAAGEAIEIMTGAAVPPGADAVAMVEHVIVTDGNVQAAQGHALLVGDNIVPRGSEALRGATVVPANSLIGAAEIALAATSGLSKLQVFVRPNVAIVATGDELVDLDDLPGDRQIRNSNSYALAALATAAGSIPARLEIARDTRDDIRQRIAQGRTFDLLLFSGGVSMGKFDLVEEVLAEFDAEFFFTGVKMQPGKPVVFGHLPAREDGNSPECYFFGLPGNPVSTQVTFHCFVEPFLRLICGEEVSGPRFVQATLGEPVDAKPGLTRVLPGHLTSDLDQPSVRLVSWQGSGDLAANARANCYAVLPPQAKEFNAADIITVLLR